MIFLDTSAIYALADEADPNHETAVRTFQLLYPSESLLTHDYVLIESGALLQRRLGLDVALRFHRQAESFQIVWTDEVLHGKGLDLLGEIGSLYVSLVDCVSFVVMRQNGIREAFAFDSDFTSQGFQLVPGP